MEHLWAPWRNRYVSETREIRENLFWEIGQSNDDAAHHVIARSKCCYAVLNLYPYNAGHTMVVPYRCVAALDELSEGEILDLWAMVGQVTAALRQAYKPGGFNVGMNLGSAAGAGLPKHLHVHVVPRWEHDANFMTALAETRIHPHDLASVHRTLSALLSGPAAAPNQSGAAAA